MNRPVVQISYTNIEAMQHINMYGLDGVFEAEVYGEE